MIYKPLKRNTPIATLIKNFINKKSGKVAESRNEIQRRFDHLDWKDQKKILMASLDSCMSDRSWAYKKLLRYWDKSFEPKVREVWDKYHEPMCSWSIIRYFPVSYIKENVESFTSKRDYYFICLRLAEDPNYVIDRKKLRTIDYLSVLFHTGRTISKEEADNLLFEVVHDMCVSGLSLLDFEDFDYDKGVFYLNNYRSIKLAKYYLNKMGHLEAEQSFDDWNEGVLQYIHLSPEYQALSKYNDDHIIDDLKIKTLKKYAYLALDQKYKLPTDTIMNELLTSEDWKLYLSHEIATSKIDTVDSPSDPQYLKELIHTNPAFKNLMDAFNLEMDSEVTPF